MKTNYAPKITATDVKYATEEVGGLKIAYREAGKPGNPKLVLLHGFPSSSHQYRNLIPALADRFHVISPDYPGFGNSDAPDPRKFVYTFDKLADVTENFLRQKGVRSVRSFCAGLRWASGLSHRNEEAGSAHMAHHSKHECL